MGELRKWTLVVLLIAGGCGDNGSSEGPDAGQCSGNQPCAEGCCLDGKCFSGTNPGACGAVGGACTRCAYGYRCVDRGCSLTDPPCSLPGCPGCCYKDKCEDGDEDTLCGSGGLPCQSCGQSGRCIDRACKVQGLDCGGEPCAGCCFQGSVCMPGLSDDQLCGRGGAPCRRCLLPQRCLGGFCQ